MITHVHYDHFYPYELVMRKVGYSHNMLSSVLTLHGSPDIESHALRLWDAYGSDGRKLLEDGRVVFDIMRP